MADFEARSQKRLRNDEKVEAILEIVRLGPPGQLGQVTALSQGQEITQQKTIELSGRDPV